MRETGLVVLSTLRGTLHQLSLQEGRLIKKEIKHPCKHGVPAVYLMCVQVAGREYLALSCKMCRNIKLMNLNKQKENGSKSKLLQYEVITALCGENVYDMCQGEENRLFVQSGHFDVLELDTSTTTFTKLKTIYIGSTVALYGLCYVPDPHRLLVVCFLGEVRAVSCDDNTVVWRAKKDKDLKPGRLLYIPSHNAILVADWRKNEVVVLNSGPGSQIQSITLPHNVYEIRGLCLFNDQIIVASGVYGRHISYFSLK